AVHPAPEGLLRTLKRAVVHGRDAAALNKVGAGDVSAPSAAARRIRRIFGSAIRDRRRLQLSLATAPVAALIALAYLGVSLTAAAFARLAPVRARRLQL